MNKTEFRSEVFYPTCCFVKNAVDSPLHLPLDSKTVQEANQLIFNKLMGEKPVMICRMGSLELETVTGYLNKDLNWFLQQIRKLHGEPIVFDAMQFFFADMGKKAVHLGASANAVRYLRKQLQEVPILE